jgi:hypothetical protein
MTREDWRQVGIALALQDHTNTTGIHPGVTVEALIRLRREGMQDCSGPATVKRFRELIDDVTRERAG